jgi:SNF2 family DNA or RNA helicase
MSVTVEEALVKLYEVDAFSRVDEAFATSLISRMKGPGLTKRQLKAATAMLRRYSKPMERLNLGDLRESEVAPAAEVVEAASRALSQGVRVSIEVINRERRICVRSPFKYKDLMKGLSGARWAGSVKAWTYPATLTCAANIEDALSRAPDPVSFDQEFQTLVDQRTVVAEAQTLKSAEDLPDVPNSKTSAWLHQRQAYHFASQLPSAMLAMEMGTGKSKVTVDILTNNSASRVLILCPVSVLRVWPREFRTHAVDDWNVVVLDKKSGKVAERVEKAEAALKLPGRTAIVINYEACDQKVFAEWALTIDWDYLVCDESHRLKMPNGSRSKYVGKLATRAARKLNLTGTPMPQTPLDVWAQFRTLDPHIFGSSFHRFKGVYALWGGYENREFMGMNPLMADDFEEKLAGITYRVTADVLDLPPDRDVERVCTLSSKAQKLYKGIKDELHGEVFNEATGDRQTVSMDNVLTKLLRMQQITGGAVNDDDGKSTEVDDSKRKLLEDVLEDIDPKSPVVVFCRFVHDLDQVKKVATKLGRNYGELSGRQNDLNDDAKMPDWCDVMAVQIQAGGVGIDLTRAHFGIYYSVGYDLGAYLQSRARLVRPGQGEEVLFIHLVAAGTIDEEVYKALSSKQKIVDYVLETI